MSRTLRHYSAGWNAIRNAASSAASSAADIKEAASVITIEQLSNTLEQMRCTLEKKELQNEVQINVTMSTGMLTLSMSQRVPGK